jgi:hypothetical protein
MALQISILYQERPLTYDVSVQEEEVYLLRLNQGQKNGDYVPEKLFIRKKGKIWVSDLENYPELVDSLAREIGSISISHNLIS